jgi:hypothetical protein
MIVHKHDALENWCPFAKVRFAGLSGPVAVNRDEEGKSDERCSCIADDCMAWRWSVKNNEHEDENVWGYCGLAGNP